MARSTHHTGTLEDYRMVSSFATDYIFSRFDKLAAPVRDTSALGGVVGPKHVHPHPGHERG